MRNDDYKRHTTMRSSWGFACNELRRMETCAGVSGSCSCDTCQSWTKDRTYMFEAREAFEAGIEDSRDIRSHE
jgi:hypothetical protein